MKKNKNYTWLVLGIITILIGIIVPVVFMSQSIYFESDKITGLGSDTYKVRIISKNEIDDIKDIVVSFTCIDNDTVEYNAHTITHNKEKNKHIYEFQFVITDSFVEDIDEIEIKTDDDSFVVTRKIEVSAKIAVSAFICIVGGFMIFVNFFNNNAKNRTIEVKELIGHSYNSAQTNNQIDEYDNLNNQADEYDNLNKQEEQHFCEYCGSFIGSDENVCSACGAKIKRTNK